MYVCVYVSISDTVISEEPARVSYGSDKQTVCPGTYSGADLFMAVRKPREVKEVPLSLTGTSAVA